jgi:hypothetical protein
LSKKSNGFPVSPGGGPGTARSGGEGEGRRWVEHGVEQVEEHSLLGGAGRKSWNDARSSVAAADRRAQDPEGPGLHLHRGARGLLNVNALRDRVGIQRRDALQRVCPVHAEPHALPRQDAAESDDGADGRFRLDLAG